ncbi:hypothetical protein LKO27_11765 [Tessaracoccus sp. OS52]|uniref:hypothetical protein n=1 Tax=Tessaracoccus sp. OS52 TaxID=2886691 RepID=UPI001D11416E|nr:hypothetical protein [Tessaracoccus sp. OS52]MCC2594083.1 hypothetical protein [Tessaracoccus sp. OS52]
MSTQADAAAAAVALRRSAADRFMRRLLRVSATDAGVVGDAHRAFRTSLVISGVRCLVTYLVVPIAVPLISFAGFLAAPLGIALCVFAVVNGVVSVRRFWISDHRLKWVYTWFMVFVFAVLGVALYADISRLVA